MSRRVLITGGNRGIGLALVEAFNAASDDVYVLCRHVSEKLRDLGVHSVSPVDVTSLQSLKDAQQRLRDVRFDIIINNAGIMVREMAMKDGNEEELYSNRLRQFEVNALGPLNVVSVFLDTLKSSGKLIMITSRMGSIADNSSGGSYGYRMSKAALNAASKSLAIDLKDRGIAVGIIHPGWVQTDLTDFSGLLTVEESAQNIMVQIDSLSLESSGSFMHCQGEVLSW